jgi:hypothetical protein
MNGIQTVLIDTINKLQFDKVNKIFRKELICLLSLHKLTVKNLVACLQ